MTPPLTHINRRDFIKKLSLMFGATSALILSERALANAFAFNQNNGDERYVSKLLTKKQLAILAAVSDCVLPETDTPSASSLYCHEFIDHQLITCHSQDEQQRCLTIINKINDCAQQLFNKDFPQLSNKQQQDILVSLEQTKSFSVNDKRQWQFLKWLIVFGYFTTEIGATVVLNYQAVPGGFIGSIPYDENSKAWGSLGFY